jgi:hypothetical protein
MSVSNAYQNTFSVTDQHITSMCRLYLGFLDPQNFFSIKNEEILATKKNKNMAAPGKKSLKLLHAHNFYPFSCQEIGTI